MKGNTGTMMSVGRYVSILLTVSFLSSVLLLNARCAETSSEPIDPNDLVDTWWDIATGTSLTFEKGAEGQIYELRDPQSYYSQLLEGGSDLLVQGYWSVSGTSLTLIDESGPAACPSTSDRYVITLNDAKTVMSLTHLGDECEIRAMILEDRAWQKRVEDSS